MFGVAFYIVSSIGGGSGSYTLTIYLKDAFTKTIIESGTANFSSTDTISIKTAALRPIQSITSVSNENANPLTKTFMLSQNYPNPFNPSTTIEYRIPERSFVKLKVFDVLGREVARLVNGEKPAGDFFVTFNAANLPSGIYFYTLEAGSFKQSKKLIILK